MFSPVELATLRCTIEDEAYTYGGYNRPPEIFNPSTAPRYLTEGPLKALSAGERFGPTWLWVECYLRAHPDLYDETPASVQARQYERAHATGPMVNAAGEHLRAGRFEQARTLLDQAQLVNPADATDYVEMRSRIERLAGFVDKLGLSAHERFDGVHGQRARVVVGEQTFLLEPRRGQWIVHPGADADAASITEALPVREVMPRIRAHLAERPEPGASAAVEIVGTETHLATPRTDPPEPAALVEDATTPLPILIEHTAEGTLVRNTDKANLQLRQALHDAKFQWSRPQKFWYQRRATDFAVRTRRVGYLRASLTRLGLPFTETGAATTSGTAALASAHADTTPQTEHAIPIESSEAQQDSTALASPPAASNGPNPAPTPSESQAPTAVPVNTDQPPATPSRTEAATAPVTTERANATGPVNAGFRRAEWLPAPEVEIPRSPQRRIEANLAAIQTIQVLERDNRTPTPAERETLAKWTSWGAAAAIFDAEREEFRVDAESLRTLIGETGWKQANRTVLNAHYTDPMIVRAMWDHLQSLGFVDGRVLEPGCGAGAFIGRAPESARVTGVELDSTTARIAQALYPHADIRVESFADTRLPEGHFDAAIGNVPFSSTRLHDPVHNTGEHSMHDHFILKSLALTKPGGVVAVVTSSFTLDKKNPSARREIAAHADFLGAVRLPNGTHRRVAGTDVVTDILILRRRDGAARRLGGPYELATSTEVPLAKDAGEAEVVVNEYFLNNPDMVLGELRAGTSIYGGLAVVVHGRGDLEQQLREALDRIARQALDEGIAHQPRELVAGERRAAASAPGDANEFPGHLRATTQGFEALHVDGTYSELTIPKTQAEELRALLGLRDTAVALLENEAANAEDSDEIEALRTRLNRRYDHYTERFGPINRCTWHPTGRVDDAGEPVMSVRRPPVMRVFRDDPHAPIVLALEDYDATTDAAVKMAIMRQRVVAPRTPRTGADTAEDAVAICLDTHGRIDLPVIAGLLGSDDAQALAQCRGLIYPDPADDGRFVPAAEYLSGNVRLKLDQARDAAATNPETYSDNVTALTGVIPVDLGPAEIDARLGAVWIDAPDVQAFLNEVLNDDTITVEHTKAGEWKVTGGRRGVLATQEFGTARVPAPKLAQALLRQAPVRVFDPDENGEARIPNPTETEAANEKAEQLNERFSEWVWENPVRAARLSEEYNRRFNNLVLRNYETDGKMLSLPGLSRVYTPRPHQRAAVARMIAEPNVGLFHAVGAGKTLEMAMGVMELKRLGLVNKPAIMVPNSMLDQFAREFLQAYPQARILAAGTEDLAGEKRRQFVARAATGDWDAIILTRGSFQRLEVARDTAHWYFDREIQPRREYLAELMAGGAKRTTVKRIEDAILKSEEKLKKKVGGPTDPGITFEQTGIDYLVVDELHDFKNLATDTQIESAAIAGSQRAQKLHMVVEYLRDKHGGRAITGATATPLANSITEAYVVQRYLRPDLLEDAGIRNFDEWAATFGRTRTELEMSVDGNSWSLKTRLVGFRNVVELQRMFHVAADVKLPEDLKLPVPKLARRADGERAPEVISVPATDTQLEYVRELGERAQKVKSRAVDPTTDNMLKISSDGRAAALDLRLVRSLGLGSRSVSAHEDRPMLDIAAGGSIARHLHAKSPSPATARYVALYSAMSRDQPDEEVGEDQFGLKLEAAADWMFDKWQAAKDQVFLGRDGQPHPRRGGLVLAFCDLGTPGEDWNAYDELKTKLIVRGAPAELFAYIHDAKNDKGKAALFTKARNGSIQFLFGSTSKMGVGVNIQDRMVAMLHVDCPWRPADIEQRDGRGIRQGNQNAEIAVARAVTEGTFDARMWAAQSRKAAMVNQFLKGSLTAREIDDIGDAALNANEALAIASGNPLVLEKAEVDIEVTKLERLRRAHQRSQSMLHIRMRDADNAIPSLEAEIDAYTHAIAHRTPTKGDAFAAKVNGRFFDHRGEAGDALAARLSKLTQDPRSVWKEFSDQGVAEIAGFTLDARNVPTGRDAHVAVVFSDVSADLYVTFDGKTLEKGGAGVMLRLENAVNGLDKRLDIATSRLATERTERERSEQRLGKPFEHSERLDALRERQKAINQELLRGDEVQPEAPSSGPKVSTDEAEFIQSAAKNEAAAMVHQFGGAAVVNGANGISILTNQGRPR
ncbi:N12 class adenine-specific DNA methylase [Nocardia ignorata]|uniref:N12 class adenine-specific DNA methylase n=3 Tax=Actinomycetes TaxID=1760 RepID=A0A4R6PLA6_NOCIG|nr:N12 class adenine-specific DNA methylase [Nocardia ignorata]